MTGFKTEIKLDSLTA